MSVYLSASTVHISGTTLPHFTKFSAHVSCGMWPWLGRSLAALQYVMHFRYHERPCVFIVLWLQRRERANVLAASYWLRCVRDDGGLQD